MRFFSSACVLFSFLLYLILVHSKFQGKNSGFFSFTDAEKVYLCHFVRWKIAYRANEHGRITGNRVTMNHLRISEHGLTSNCESVFSVHVKSIHGGAETNTTKKYKIKTDDEQ